MNSSWFLTLAADSELAILKRTRAETHSGCTHQQSAANRSSNRSVISMLGRSVECFTPNADDPNPLIGVEVPSDRGSSQIGLRVHEARRWIYEHGRHAYHRFCVVARAIAWIG
jgi:hypothetical protein